MKRILALRQDNNGDVLLVGPALRAVAHSGAHVTLLCGERGAAAGRTLPDIARVLVWEAAWIDAHPRPVTKQHVANLLSRIEGEFDEALIFTSFHQSPLPAALLLRLAGITRIGAISVDYPGSLLDVRHRADDDIHEVERALSLTRAMGYALPANDDGRLRMRVTPPPFALPKQYVVVHPGASVSARTWIPQRFMQLTAALQTRGIEVVVTGSPDECTLARTVASHGAVDVSGRTTFEEFAAIVQGARAIVTGNTAAAHVGAAVHTPVVSIFPPTIPLARFRPWMVPSIVLGDQEAPCAGCRARVCPVATDDGQPCLLGAGVDEAMRALERLGALPTLAVAS